jgi:hypothetical protein
MPSLSLLFHPPLTFLFKQWLSSLLFQSCPLILFQIQISPFILITPFLPLPSPPLWPQPLPR